MSKNFKQYNTEWAKLGYPKKPWYIKDCGCGEVAIANVIVETDKYKNETPKTIQPWCKQFAAPNGDGTYWSAPPTMMAHYGLTECQEHQTMNPLWKELAKGNRVAIYLMSNRKAGSKGIKWTGSKHFICSTNYKYDKKTGKHWVYVKDSNSTSASRNGWVSYEDNLRNAVFKVWSGKLPAKPQPAPKKSIDEIAKEVIDGKWGNGDARVKALKEAGYDPEAVQKRVNELLTTETWVDKANKWALKICADNTYHYVKWKSKDVKTHECPICHNHPVGYSHGWNCIGFSFAVWHHGGGLPSKCSDGVIANEVWEKILNAKTDAEALAIAQKHVGLKDLKVIRNKNNIPHSQWKAGDIMGKFNGNKYIHTYYYMGNGKIAESTGSSGKIPNNDQIRTKPWDKYKAKVIVRYIGK